MLVLVRFPHSLTQPIQYSWNSLSGEYWAGKAHGSSDNRGKMLRRDGFALAQERYTEYKPLLEEVEKILAEAGLDEEEIKRGAAAGAMPKQTGESRNRR